MAVKSQNLTREKVGVTAVITAKHVLKEHGHNITETCLQRKKFSPDEPCLTLNAELNPICHLQALLGTHSILHVSRIRVKVSLSN